MSVYAVALTVAALAPGAAFASGWGFSVRPATFDPHDPATRAYFKPTIRAGGTYTGAVVVTNLQSTPVHVFAYPVDGLTAVTSGAVYGNRGAVLHAAGGWVTTPQPSLTLPAHSRERVPFTVRVPPSAAPGDHLAGIAIENADAVRSHGRRLSIIELFRAVVGVEVRVPGPARSALRVTGAALNALPGTKMASIVVGLQNVGGLTCKPRLAVSLHGSGPARAVAHRLDTLLPATAIAYPLPWPYSLAPGGYDVSVHTTGCGAPARLTRSLRLGVRLHGLDRSAPAQRPRAAARARGWLAPGLAGIALLLIALLGVIARRRGRRPMPRIAGLSLLDELLASEKERPVSLVLLRTHPRHARALAAAVRPCLRPGDRVCLPGEKGQILLICPDTSRGAAIALQEGLSARVGRRRRLADVPIEMTRATAAKRTSADRLVKRVSSARPSAPAAVAPLKPGTPAAAAS